MLTRVALFLGLLAGAQPESPPPSLTADLDGDGTAESVTAAASGEYVRLDVRNADGSKRASARAPAPRADVIHVALTSAPIGSAGALVALSAASDATECLTVWRLRGGSLAQLPIRGADGKDLPDCATSGQWVIRWEQEAEGRPARMVREREEEVAQGRLRTREVFSFAGFSLDYDAERSAREINGVPIPSWYGARLYTRTGLDRLYERYDLASFKAQPMLTILTDRERGVFALRLDRPAGAITAPVDAFAWTPSSGAALLSGRAGDRVVHVTVRLAKDGVPYEARVEGLGPELDQVYSPAGTWHGESQQVFPSAADELASEDLAGVWDDARGGRVSIAIEGAPPYRVRMGKAVYAVDIEHAAPPVDMLLLPADGSDRAWGLVLRGPNGIERVPLACSGEGPGRACHTDGDKESLRRLGALVNVR